jgi:hypothetical protein
LGTQMLLYRDWVVGAAFVGEVVAENHALLAIYYAYTSDHVP